MSPASEDEIGLQADVVKDAVRTEAAGDVFAAGGRRMDAAECRADQRGESRVGLAVAQQSLPYRVARRRQVLHGEQALTGREHVGYGMRRRFSRDLEPFGFVAVALDWRFPDLGDAQ